jgi:hypothetical protein
MQSSSPARPCAYDAFAAVVVSSTIEPKSSIQALSCYEYPARASGYLDLELLDFSALSLLHNDSMMMI